MNDNENSVSDQEEGFIITIENLTARELAYLRLVCNRELSLDIPEMSSDRFKGELLRYKKHKTAIMKCLEWVRNQALVPEEYFEWLQSNLRAQIFTLIYMRQIAIATIESINEERKESGQHYLHPPSYETIRVNHKGYIIEQIYDLLDNYQIEFKPVFIDKKIRYIKDIRFLWSNIYSQKSYKNLLEEDNQEQIEWAKEYLQKKGYYIDNIHGTVSYQQNKAVLLASLDLIEFKSGILKKSEYQESPTKNKFMDRMKKSWAQKKSRDAGTARKPYHLALKTNVKDKLDEVARINNKKPVDMLESLIELAYENQRLDKYDKEKY